ncbi:unnamed protein product [Rotaria sordida]|uniref:Uncharacterized protein n=1 Tax=Rotaria sordida TaxID=392033 RepID=A0A815NHX4_9BILA|nr:unnamed protein product [Rotaria sordida]CAF1490603.1 unnamed protein product [Rotaria sordida]CAF4049725.1 unnamed protein product [Rotaria sordida]CAF4140538.1 unnamed protein product [Rotaria sordida]
MQLSSEAQKPAESRINIPLLTDSSSDKFQFIIKYISTSQTTELNHNELAQGNMDHLLKVALLIILATLIDQNFYLKLFGADESQHKELTVYSHVNNKLVVTIGLKARSEIFHVTQALHLNLNVPDGPPISLPVRNIYFIPTTVLIDIPSKIMQEMINYLFELKEGFDIKKLQNDEDAMIMGDIQDDKSDGKSHPDDQSDDDPDAILIISASITHMLVDDDIKYVTSNRVSITANNWFATHHVTIRGPNGNQSFNPL